MMLQPVSAGGWGLTPQDIDVVAHSLGNVVMWDALRINAALTPKKVVHNVTSIEAAIFQEAFDPVGPLTYKVPSSTGGRPYFVDESVSQQQQSGWRSWFNPGDRNIKSSVAGKIINSYNAGDSALEKMRLNEFVKTTFNQSPAGLPFPWGLPSLGYADRNSSYNAPPVYRSAENLNTLRTYIRPNSSITRSLNDQAWIYSVNDLNQAIGTMQNPIADVNIDASAGFGWRQAQHSDFEERELPRIWPWWFEAVSQQQAVATGVQ